MKNNNSEQLYYKVENKDSALFKRASEFLAMEENLREIQRKTIESKVPKFSKCRVENSKANQVGTEQGRESHKKGREPDSNPLQADNRLQPVNIIIPK